MLIEPKKAPVLSFTQCVSVAVIAAIQARPESCVHGHLRSRQNGAALLIALIMLVAMTLAGIALVRSVDTTNIIAGNLAFQQATTHSGDQGIEAAITWLQVATPATLEGTAPAANSYVATWAPAAIASWDNFWSLLPVPPSPAVADAGGNSVSYFIERMCLNAGSSITASCSFAPVVCADGSLDGGGTFCGKGTRRVYYRITVRIAGLRNTKSYIQSIIAK